MQDMSDIYSRSEKAKYYFYWLLEHIFGPRDGVGHFGKKRNALATLFQQRVLKRPKVAITQIETIENISENEFLQKYVIPRRSVLIKGAAKNWPAVGKWTHHYLAEKYPTATQPFVDPKTNGYGYSELTFKQIADEIDKGSDSYVKFSAFMHKTPGIENDMDLSLIEKYKVVKHIPSSKQFFMGGPGTRTLIHAALANVFFIQVTGKKRWLLIDEKWSPVLNPIIDRQPHFIAQEEMKDPFEPSVKDIFDRIDMVEVNLEPGDFYFNPAFCWHYVENPVFSIGVAFRWIPLRAMFQSPMLSTYILLAQYPFAAIRAFSNPRGVFFPKRWP